MKNWKNVVAVSALAMLAACGGGGGGGSASTVTIGGTAAKGLITNAKVLVYATDSSGRQIATPIAEGTTNANGLYSIAIPPQSNPVIISIVKGTGSKVMDELTGLSEDMPSDFELKAVTSSVTKDATIGVNPFTDVAAASIPTTGFTKDMVDTANHWVKTNLTSGVDPVAVQPVLTTAAAQGSETQQKTLTAALALVAAAAKNNTNCAAAGTVSEKFKCQIVEMRDTVKFTDNGGTPKLSSVNGRITTLMTDTTVINAVNNATELKSVVDVTSDVASLTTNTNLANIKNTIGSTTATTSDTTGASKLTALAPPTVTEIQAAQDATTYAKNLKAAIKSANSDFIAQKNFFETTYMNKVTPTMSTVDGGLNLITKYCSVDKTTMAVTCSAPSNKITFTGSNGGTVTLSGAPNSYSWSGTAGTSTITGTMQFSGSCSQPAVCSLRANINGQFPNDISGEAPLNVVLDVSMSVDDLAANVGTDKRSFEMTVNSAQVTFPATTSFPSAVATLTNAKVLGKIYQYGAYRVWNCWDDALATCFTARSGATDTTSLPTHIQGTLALTSTYSSGGTTYSDVLTADVTADMLAPTQAVWTSLDARSRYFLDRNKVLDYFKVTGSLKVGKYNSTYAISATADPDWSAVDLTKPLSSTNYPKGSVSVSLDGGNVGGTSLAKMVLAMTRIDFNNSQPSLQLTAGGDTFTFQPNTTNGYLAVSDPGLTSMWGAPANYPSTNWFRLSLESTGIMSTSGVKAFNSNNAYTIQVSKVDNKIAGTVKKGTATVGQVTDGRLYLDGQIFPLTLD